MYPLALPHSPLRQLMSWFASPAQISATAPLAAQDLVPVVRRPAERRARPLRVVRVIDGQQARSAAGRMLISGRFADVCAELDRLAAAERH